MNKLFMPVFGPTDWRRLLAEPITQWERRKSAFECAISWERARRNERSLPLEIANVLDGNDVTHNAALLLGFPEHQVRIEGGGHASQNDVWALLQLRDGAASMSVEAKSGEPFDKLVADWLRVRSDGSNKPQRLDSLRRTLGIVEENVDGIRYQLLHRTASPLLEAKRFRASIAIMIVQSFGGAKDENSYKDFKNFCAVMGCDAIRNGLTKSTQRTEVPLYLGWVDCEPADGDQIAEASEQKTKVGVTADY